MRFKEESKKIGPILKTALMFYPKSADLKSVGSPDAF